MNFLEAAVHWLHGLGFFTILVPFVLIYAIAYGLLERIKIWGKGNTSNYSAVFAFSLAFFTIFQIQLAEKMGLFIARIGLLFVIVIAVIIISGLVDVHTEHGKGIVKFLIVGYILYNIIDIFFDGRLWSWIAREEAIPGIIAVVATVTVFFIIVAFVMREPKRQENIAKKPEGKKEEQKKPPETQQVNQMPTREERVQEIMREFPSMSKEDAIKMDAYTSGGMQGRRTRAQ